MDKHTDSFSLPFHDREGVRRLRRCSDRRFRLRWHRGDVLPEHRMERPYRLGSLLRQGMILGMIVAAC